VTQDVDQVTAYDVSILALRAVLGLTMAALDYKIPALTQPLTGRFTDHHAFLARVHLDLIDQHTPAIDEITMRIEEMIAPFHGFRDLICTIPGHQHPDKNTPGQSIAIWHMGTNGCLYDDPGADYFNRLHPERAKKRAINQLEAMGYQVTFTHAS
jgi:hypothetical protein